MADTPPILRAKAYAEDSVFDAAGLLRAARREKALPERRVPRVVLLDPDGDVVRRLHAEGRGQPDPSWACYHSQLSRFRLAGQEVGVIGCAVGAPYAVLVAEELFACGCQLAVSVTSAGQIAEDRQPPYHVLIDWALRDEGTSYHYRSPGEASAAPADLAEWAAGVLAGSSPPVLRGGSWTTDAPFRETPTALAAAREAGVEAVEMEAAALYAMAEAKGRNVLCFAHVTNQMAQVDGDFDKGEASGTTATLGLLERLVWGVFARN